MSRPCRRSLPAEPATGNAKSGRNWARTSDLRLVEAALSQLSYTPGRRKGSNDPPAYRAGTGSRVVATTSGSFPFALIVISKVSSVS